jgi:DinB superfamily
LTPAFLGDASALGLDLEATPSFEEVLDVRRQRMDRVRQFLATVTADERRRPRYNNDAAGYPPATEDTVLDCLHVVMDEEWNHHQYATRDLAILTATA